MGEFLCEEVFYRGYPVEYGGKFPFAERAVRRRHKHVGDSADESEVISLEISLVEVVYCDVCLKVDIREVCVRRSAPCDPVGPPWACRREERPVEMTNRSCDLRGIDAED